MFIWRNKLPQLACSKLTTTSTQWTGASQERHDGFMSKELVNPELDFLKFIANEGVACSTVDRLHYLQSLNQPSKTKHEPGHLRRSATPTPEILQCQQEPEGKDSMMVLSGGDYWNETSRVQKQFRKTRKKTLSMTDISVVPDIIPLDVLFTICSEKHGWLRIQDKKVTFLHSTDTSASDKSVKFVVGCYLAFLGHTDSDKSPLTNRTPCQSHWKVNNKVFVAPQQLGGQLSQIMYSVGMDTNQIKNYGGPSQKRFAQYFLSVLYASSPPPEQITALRIDRVVVSGLEQIRRNLRINRVLSTKWRDCVLHPVLVIYQKGKLKWKKVVPIEDSVLDFSPEVDVVGDAVVGIWFVKDCVSTNDPPVVAFSFHSGFMEAGVVQLSSADLSILGVDITGLFDGPSTTITMDLTLSYSPVPAKEVEQWEPVMEFHPLNEQWLAERGDLPEIYATVKQSQSKQALNKNLSFEKKELEDISIQKESEPRNENLYQAPVTPTAVEDLPTIQKQSLQEPPKKIVSPFQKAGERKKAPPPPPPKRKSETARISSSSLSISKNKEVSKTKPLYWSITPKQSGTVWSELLPQDSVNESRLSLLEDLFCKDDVSKQKIPENEQPASCEGPKKRGGAVAVSIGRANNVSIMMTRFKRYTDKVDELCKDILTGKAMSTEELILLSQIGPTEGEARDLKEHDREELSGPEQIMLGMTVVPRLRIKASCQVAIRTWDDHYSDAVNMLETMKLACQQIRLSKRLKRVFTAVLSVGNTMNKGTSRGNAGGIKIESLSKLWDTKVSRNASTREGKSGVKLHRAGSVPTVISQCLEIKEVENKISSLLDFTAVLVHDNDQSLGVGHCEKYLQTELESLSEAVAYLEDGINDLLLETDKGFELLEREFQDMTGKSWNNIDSSDPDSVDELKIKRYNVFLEEQHSFLRSSYQFLIMAGGARTFLKQEVNVSDQYLKSTVQWLGEDNGDNPKLHLRQLLEFARQFDQSYKKLKN